MRKIMYRKSPTVSFSKETKAATITTYPVGEKPCHQNYLTIATSNRDKNGVYYSIRRILDFKNDTPFYVVKMAQNNAGCVQLMETRKFSTPAQAWAYYDIVTQ